MRFIADILQNCAEAHDCNLASVKQSLYVLVRSKPEEQITIPYLVKEYVEHELSKKSGKSFDREGLEWLSDSDHFMMADARDDGQFANGLISMLKHVPGLHQSAFRFLMDVDENQRQFKQFLSFCLEKCESTYHQLVGSVKELHDAFRESHHQMNEFISLEQDLHNKKNNFRAITANFASYEQQERDAKVEMENIHTKLIPKVNQDIRESEKEYAKWNQSYEDLLKQANEFRNSYRQERWCYISRSWWVVNLKIRCYASDLNKLNFLDRWMYSDQYLSATDGPPKFTPFTIVPTNPPRITVLGNAAQDIRCILYLVNGGKVENGKVTYQPKCTYKTRQFIFVSFELYFAVEINVPYQDTSEYHDRKNEYLQKLDDQIKQKTQVINQKSLYQQHLEELYNQTIFYGAEREKLFALQVSLQAELNITEGNVSFAKERWQNKEANRLETCRANRGCSLFNENRFLFDDIANVSSTLSTDKLASFSPVSAQNVMMMDNICQVIQRICVPELSPEAMKLSLDDLRNLNEIVSGERPMSAYPEAELTSLDLASLNDKIWPMPARHHVAKAVEHMSLQQISVLGFGVLLCLVVGCMWFFKQKVPGESTMNKTMGR